MITKIDKTNIRFRFGKYKDQLISDILKTDAKYVSWYCKTTQFESDKISLLRFYMNHVIKQTINKHQNIYVSYYSIENYI